MNVQALCPPNFGCIVVVGKGKEPMGLSGCENTGLAKVVLASAQQVSPLVEGDQFFIRILWQDGQPFEIPYRSK